MSKDPGANTFKQITNNDIYKEVTDTKNHVLKLTEGIKFNRKWLYGLSAITMALVTWAIGIGIQ